MSKKVIVRALAALLAVMMSAVSLSGCGKKLKTEDNGSFSMGDFTISGSGDESGAGDSRLEESKDGTSSGDKQSPKNSAASGSGKSTGKKTSLTAKQVLENLKAVLEASGAALDTVLKTTCFLADMADFAPFNELYAAYFTGCPARSCVAVKQLPKGVLVEVEAIAAVR